MAKLRKPPYVDQTRPAAVNFPRPAQKELRRIGLDEQDVERLGELVIELRHERPLYQQRLRQGEQAAKLRVATKRFRGEVRSVEEWTRMLLPVDFRALETILANLERSANRLNTKAKGGHPGDAWADRAAAMAIAILRGAGIDVNERPKGPASIVVQIVLEAAGAPSSGDAVRSRLRRLRRQSRV